MDILSLFDSSQYTRCIACDRLIRNDDMSAIEGKIGICSDCSRHLPIVPVGSIFDEKNGYVNYSMSTFFYKPPIKSLILDYKFNNCINYAEVFAQYMKDYLIPFRENGFGADLVIPVPLSKKRMKTRKYNQSQLLSEPIAEFLNIPHSDKALKRTEDTPHQSRLPAFKRGENLKKAFTADPALVKGKSILLIDDVYTTGNTAKACGFALHNAGAKNIVVYTLSRKFSTTKSKEYKSLLQN